MSIYCPKAPGAAGAVSGLSCAWVTGCSGALHAHKAAVCCGGVRHSVVGSTRDPSGKVVRQRIPLPVLGKIIGTRLLPRLQLTPEAERPVGRQVAGFCPQRNGAAGKVAHKIHQCHGTVHGTVGVGGGVVEQNVVRHHGIVMAEAPQPHPHPGRVALAADATLHLHGHRAAVVDLGCWWPYPP